MTLMTWVETKDLVTVVSASTVEGPGLTAYMVLVTTDAGIVT